MSSLGPSQPSSPRGDGQSPTPAFEDFRTTPSAGRETLVVFQAMSQFAHELQRQASAGEIPESATIAAPLVGTSLRVANTDYQLSSFLGAGDQGLVFRARTADGNDNFAIKLTTPFLVLPHEDILAVRFSSQSGGGCYQATLRALTFMARAAHTVPNVHRLVNASLIGSPVEEQKVGAIVTEFAPGTTLEQFARNHQGEPIPQDLRRAIDREIQNAIVGIANADVKMRELSPENILVVVDSESRLANLTIIDFGNATISMPQETERAKREMLNGIHELLEKINGLARETKT